MAISLSFLAPVTRTIGKLALTTQKNAPSILLVSGIVGIGATIVLASKAGVKAAPVIEEFVNDVDRLDEVDSGENLVSYKLQIFGRYARDMIKIYAPTIAVAAVTVGCFSKGQGILVRRNAALAASFAAVSESFAKYRKNVELELGGTRAEEVQFKGTKEELKELEDHGIHERRVTPNVSIYARFFDEASPKWCKTPEMNLLAIDAAQSQLNLRLQTRGHVFLNEAYDALGIPRSQAGQLVGWVYKADNGGDNYIDFGIYEGRESARRFVNGDERSILLDFNVDGVVYDLI